MLEPSDSGSRNSVSAAAAGVTVPEGFDHGTRFPGAISRGEPRAGERTGERIVCVTVVYMCEWSKLARVADACRLSGAMPADACLLTGSTSTRTSRSVLPERVGGGSSAICGSSMICRAS